MSKQCLDVRQMQHLQELGLDTSNASMYWLSYNGVSVDIPINFHLSTSDNDYVICNAYTLQDVLDALPYSIECDKGDVYWLQIEKMDMKNDDWRVSYLIFSQYKYFHCFQSPHLIDAAYELLVWCIENKFVETNKNE